MTTMLATLEFINDISWHLNLGVINHITQDVNILMSKIE